MKLSSRFAGVYLFLFSFLISYQENLENSFWKWVRDLIAGAVTSELVTSIFNPSSCTAEKKSIPAIANGGGETSSTGMWEDFKYIKPFNP